MWPIYFGAQLSSTTYNPFSVHNYCVNEAYRAGCKKWTSRIHWLNVLTDEWGCFLVGPRLSRCIVRDSIVLFIDWIGLLTLLWQIVRLLCAVFNYARQSSRGNKRPFGGLIAWLQTVIDHNEIRDHIFMRNWESNQILYNGCAILRHVLLSSSNAVD